MFSMAQHGPHTSYEDEHPGFEYLLQHNASVPFDAAYHDAAHGANIHPSTLGHNSSQLPHAAAAGTPQTLDSPFYPDMCSSFSLDGSFSGNHDQYYQSQAEDRSQEVRRAPKSTHFILANMPCRRYRPRTRLAKWQPAPCPATNVCAMDVPLLGPTLHIPGLKPRGHALPGQPRPRKQARQHQRHHSLMVPLASSQST
jgi:hypothetical protein